MLSGGGGSCHGRPGRYQEGIGRLCLDDRTLPVSPSLLSVHRRPLGLRVTAASSA